MALIIKSRKAYSLEKVIAHRLLLTILPAFAVLVVIVHLGMNQIMESYIASRLQHDAENFISALQPNDYGWTLPDEAIPRAYKRVRSGQYFIIKWDRGEFRSRSLWDIRVNPYLTGKKNDSYYLNDIVKGENWLVRQLMITKKDTRFSVWVAEDITPVQATLLTYEYYLIGTLILFSVLLLVWQRRILRVGFSRLNPLRDALTSGRFDKAVAIPEDIPHEVTPLVDSICQLVRCSTEQTSRSRMALGNLAHELKLPLQHLKSLIEQSESEEMTAQLDEVYQQLQRRIDSELRRARISGNPMPGTSFDAMEEIPYLVKLLNRMRGSSIQFDCNVPDETMPFDRDDMLELLGNLLDNAWRFARTRVNLVITEENSVWYLVVEDDGFGVDEEELKLLSQRGVRLDENEQPGGYGLGLSISRSIADSYGGKILFERSELGGLQVKVAI